MELVSLRAFDTTKIPYEEPSDLPKSSQVHVNLVTGYTTGHHVCC